MNKLESIHIRNEPCDPALPGDPFQRVRYGYGLLLGVEDFEAEQKSALLRDRVHAAALHGCGTVAGLAVRAELDDANRPTRLVIAPGIAIDALGRTIHVDQPICLDVTNLFEHERWPEFSQEDIESDGDDGPETITVRRAWITLRYCASLEREVPGPRGAVCEPSENGLMPSRVRDGYRAELASTEPAADALARLELPDDPLDARHELVEMLTSPEHYQRIKACWQEPGEESVTLAEVWLTGDRDHPPVSVERLDDSCRRLLVPVQPLAEATLAGAACPVDRFAVDAVEERSSGEEFRVALCFTSPPHQGTVAAAVSLKTLATDPTASWTDLTPTFEYEDAGRTLVVRADASGLADDTEIRLSVRGDSEEPLVDQTGRVFGGYHDAPRPSLGTGRDLHTQFTWPMQGADEP